MAVAWSSGELVDSEWDDFLQKTPLGHFQQSSSWALVKARGGWRPIRVIVTIDDRISAGFQLLTRPSRFGKIGYIYKGPVAVPEKPALVNFLIELIISSTKTSRLRAVIVQPPDQSTIDGRCLAHHRFLVNHLVSIISATLLSDLAEGIDGIARGMRRATQVEIRRARRRGVTIREGSEADLGAFFRLMLATCERQRTQPDPATEPALLQVWHAFRPNQVRLFLAECEGRVIAGVFLLCFGDRVTGWKKGWSGEYRERHPNSLLLFETIEWSCRNGYQLFDFCAVRSDIAATLLRGESLTDEQRRSRDFVNLSFGHKPILLPEGRLYIGSPIVRLLYRAVTAHQFTRRLIQRLVPPT